MSLLYRAMWQSEADGLLGTVDREFRRWAKEQPRFLDLSCRDEARSSRADAKIETPESNEHGSISRFVVHEDNDETRWITTVTAIVERRAATGWVWVDLESVSTAYYSGVKFAAPRLVRYLLDALPSSRRGPVELRSQEFKLGPREMQEFGSLLVDPERDLPLVVFSRDSKSAAQFTIDRAQMAAETLAGIAQVHLLVPYGEDQFREVMGSELGVWSGACRVYMPGIDLEEPVSWHHRYFLSRSMGDNPRDAGLIVARYLSPRMARQRAPRAYVRLRHLLDVDQAKQIDELWSDNDRLEDELASARDSYLSATAEWDRLASQLPRLQRDIRRAWTTNGQLWAAIDAAGARESVESQLIPIATAENEDLPEPPDKCADVPEFAVRHLRFVKFHPNACEDLDRLDDQLQGPLWAKTSWQALCALDQYAQQAPEFSGGFYNWCSDSGSPYAWPPAKLAMKESDSVHNNPKYHEPRVRPVDTAVHPDGKMFMEKHIKVAEGGGPLIPRIYFEDDTGGATGKIHIGFFGPHDLVPNPSAN